MSSPVTILTHGDLDGMVCGILLLRAVSRDSNIRITNGNKLATELRAITDPVFLGPDESHHRLNTTAD